MGQKATSSMQVVVIETRPIRFDLGSSIVDGAKALGHGAEAVGKAGHLNPVVGFQSQPAPQPPPATSTVQRQ
jgi:hypothetical protein